MNSQAADDTPDAFGRYVGIRFVDGEVYIYDEENPKAWVQSDSAVPLAAAV
jgi:hypothetical protein